MFRFVVQAMSCGGCARAITTAIQSVDQAAKIEVDLTGRAVSVETVASEQSLVEVMGEAGYQAEAVSLRPGSGASGSPCKP